MGGYDAKLPFLEISGVTKQYGPVPALVDCNLSVGRGEFVTLLGPSGCGKTTTLRMIAGFARPDAGLIRLDGRILSSPTVHIPPEKRGMGMVFQNYAIWPHMSVRRNVGLPLKLRGVSKKQLERTVNEVLETCQLLPFGDRHPHQLSGGQLQRVALARALVYKPDIILLDEPLSNLDVALREELQRELHKLHRQVGATFILVTHDQIEAMTLSDRIIVMRHGRIEQFGAPREIYRKPATSFVAQFVGSANVLSGKVLGRLDGELEGTHRVEFGPMRLTVRSWPQAQVGQQLDFAIHPEAVQVSSGPAERVGESEPLSGTIKGAYFKGRTQEVVVDLNGTEVRSVQVRGQKLDIGDRVNIAISADAILPLLGNG